MHTRPVQRITLVVYCFFVLLRHTAFAMSVMSTNVTSNRVVVKADHIKVEISNPEQISWINKMKLLRSGVRDCVKQLNKTSWSCFKRTSLRLFDDMMLANIIPICPGVRFVRSQDFPKTFITNNGIFDDDKRKDLEYLTWFDQLALRLAGTMKTHTLEINLKQITDAYIEATEKLYKQKKLKDTDPNGTARHRRHRYNMIITMMFGVTALGAVLVPMGFQLLSVVSGKALLLAKMALLLASINGLKRVANSGVHYGLYQVPGEHYGAGYYDRGDVHHPRNVPALTLAQPIDFGK